MEISDYGTRISLNGYSFAWPHDIEQYYVHADRYSDQAEIYVVVRLHNQLISKGHEKGKVIKAAGFPAMHIRNAIKNYENK